MTILTPTSGGSITGADGTVWTMDAAGDVIMNGTDVPGGAGTGALTVVGSQAWGLDSTSGIWYIWNGANWISQSGPPPVVPAGVTGLTHGTITNTSVAMSWTAALLATSYVIQRSTDGGTTFADFGTSSTPSVTQAGLTAGTPYEFRVCGVDSTGRGPFSSPISVTTTGSSLALPGQPTGLAGSVVSSSEIDVSWTAPTAGGAVASYTVQAVVNGGALQTLASGLTATSAHLTGLLASSTYVIDVEGVNATGTGTASTTASFSTPASGPTIASVQAQITQAEGLVSQLSTLLTSINTNVGLL